VYVVVLLLVHTRIVIIELTYVKEETPTRYLTAVERFRLVTCSFNHDEWKGGRLRDLWHSIARYKEYYRKLNL
jgi:hypothetical protein